MLTLATPLFTLREMSEFEQLISALSSAQRILVFTGAGISTGSGIPDFRGPGGVWTKRTPVYYDEFLSRESARVEYWDFKLEGWPAFRDATPNSAHRAIAELEARGKVLAVVTQNVDGLHRAAGESDRLIELHGTNREVECVAGDYRAPAAASMQRFADTRTPPLCPRCGGFLKPAVIMFGQSLDPQILARAFAAADACDLALSLGSTLQVTPAADVPLRAARRGVPYVIVNRGDTAHDGVADLRISADVTELLPRVVAALA